MPNMEATTYCGQSADGWDFIGTEDFKLPVGTADEMPGIVAELKRCCGESADLYLFRKAAG